MSEVYDETLVDRVGDDLYNAYIDGYKARDNEIIHCVDCKHRKEKDAGYVCTAFYGFEPWVGDEFFCGNGEKDGEDKS